MGKQRNHASSRGARGSCHPPRRLPQEDGVAVHCAASCSVLQTCPPAPRGAVGVPNGQDCAVPSAGVLVGGSQQHPQGKLVPVNIPVRMLLLQHPAPTAPHSSPWWQQAFAPQPPFLGWGRGPRLWPIQWGRTLVGLCAGSRILRVFIILPSEEAEREEKSLSVQNHSSFLIMRAVTSPAWRGNDALGKYLVWN